MDEPTLGEIGRGVGEVKAELRALRGELVRQDVYQANRAADEIRMKVLEADVNQMQNDRTAMRRLVYGALFAAFCSAGVQIVVAFAANKP